MKNEFDLVPFQNDLAGPLFIFKVSDSIKNAIGQWLSSFVWFKKASFEFLHFSSDQSDEEVLKILVPIMESNRKIIAISSDTHFIQTILKAQRYLNSPFIYNSISEKTEDIKYFYNTSNTVPDNQIEPSMKNLLRLDFTGIQIHQTHPTLSVILELTQSRVVRLGQIKENIHICEPVIRDADINHLHLDVLKYSEAPAQEHTGQSGLSSEEACQVMRYIGMSDKNKVCILSGINESSEHLSQTLNVCAQMVWYYLDAAQQLKGDFPTNRSEMTEYLVTMDDYDHEIAFLKSEKSGRWWLKPDTAIKESLSRHSLYPISYEDYEITSKGGLSEQVIKGLLWFDRISKI